MNQQHKQMFKQALKTQPFSHKTETQVNTKTPVLLKFINKDTIGGI